MHIIISIFLLSLGSAYSVTKPRYHKTQRTENFPVDEKVRKQLSFWSVIFQKYPSRVMVIHDMEEPQKIVDLIDMEVLGDMLKKKRVTRDEFNRISKSYVQRYTTASKRFADEGEKALRFGAIEKRVYDVYAREPESMKRLLKGEVIFRAQQGLADTFLDAAVDAQKYLPAMEKIFRDYGLPYQLTRLPFVESMFNYNARSKVGASGIWQFMPDTARKYLFVNEWFDERVSPLKATRAAAQYMTENFRALGSWPLAITAYNHGPASIDKAVKRLGTTSLGQIIDRYQAPSFGFASKNFYAEFLAAVNTYQHLVNSNRIGSGDQRQFHDVSEVVIPQSTHFSNLVHQTKVPRDLVLYFNPCLSNVAENERIKIPSQYTLYLPKKFAKQFKQNIARK